MATQTIIPAINPVLRRPVVEQATGDARSTIYRKIQRGLFPSSICTGRDKNGNAIQVGWLQSEVSAVINARAAGKSDEEIKELVIQLEAARTASKEAA